MGYGRWQWREVLCRGDEALVTRVRLLCSLVHRRTPLHQVFLTGKRPDLPKWEVQRDWRFTDLRDYDALRDATKTNKTFRSGDRVHFFPSRALSRHAQVTPGGSLCPTRHPTIRKTCRYPGRSVSIRSSPRVLTVAPS